MLGRQANRLIKHWQGPLRCWIWRWSGLVTPTVWSTGIQKSW